MTAPVLITPPSPGGLARANAMRARDGSPAADTSRDLAVITPLPSPEDLARLRREVAARRPAEAHAPASDVLQVVISTSALLLLSLTLTLRMWPDNAYMSGFLRSRADAWLLPSCRSSSRTCRRTLALWFLRPARVPAALRGTASAPRLGRQPCRTPRHRRRSWTLLSGRPCRFDDACTLVMSILTYITSGAVVWVVH